MKRINKLILSCVIGYCIPVAMQAQTVTFYYVAPTAAINASFPAGAQTVNMPAGYSFVQIAGANVATFQAQAPQRIKYVYNQLQPGTVLRTQINRVFNNSDRTVDVMYFLVDDRTGFAAGSHMFMPYNDAGHNYVWPAANGRGPLASGRYAGWVMLGEHQLDADQVHRTGGIHAIDEVVLHETSHTQFVGEWTKWGAVSGMAITYGADGMHYFRIAELLGDQEGALNEGLATFYGYTLNTQGMDNLINDFSDTSYRYFVEGRSVLAGERDLYTVAARRRDVLRNSSGPIHYPDGSDMTIFTYKWKDVPGWYVLFGESTSTAFYSLFWQNAYRNRDTAFSFIGYASNAMHIGRMNRFLTFACNRIALKMEEYNHSAAGAADTSKTSSLLPFAILDLVTHFGMSDADYRADYDRNHPDRQPRAYAEYFTRRAAIRALVQADLDAGPIRFAEAMRKIKNYCQQPNTFF